MALTTMYWNVVRNTYNYNMKVVQEEDGIQFWSIWALLTLTFALSLFLLKHEVDILRALIF